VKGYNFLNIILWQFNSLQVSWMPYFDTFVQNLLHLFFHVPFHYCQHTTITKRMTNYCFFCYYQNSTTLTMSTNSYIISIETNSSSQYFSKRKDNELRILVQYLRYGCQMLRPYDEIQGFVVKICRNKR
jgi:hypothetical protein